MKLHQAILTYYLSALFSAFPQGALADDGDTVDPTFNCPAFRPVGRFAFQPSLTVLLKLFAPMPTKPFVPMELVPNLVMATKSPLVHLNVLRLLVTRLMISMTNARKNTDLFGTPKPPVGKKPPKLFSCLNLPSLDSSCTTFGLALLRLSFLPGASTIKKFRLFLVRARN